MPFRSHATHFQVSCNAKITVRKHASTEHTAMNLLKRLWHWYSNRRTERRMLKGHGQYRKSHPVPVGGSTDHC